MFGPNNTGTVLVPTELSHFHTWLLVNSRPNTTYLEMVMYLYLGYNRQTRLHHFKKKLRHKPHESLYSSTICFNTTSLVEQCKKRHFFPACYGAGVEDALNAFV